MKFSSYGMSNTDQYHENRLCTYSNVNGWVYILTQVPLFISALVFAIEIFISACILWRNNINATLLKYMAYPIITMVFQNAVWIIPFKIIYGNISMSSQGFLTAIVYFFIEESAYSRMCSLFLVCRVNHGEDEFEDQFDDVVRRETHPFSTTVSDENLVFVPTDEICVLWCCPCARRVISVMINHHSYVISITFAFLRSMCCIEELMVRWYSVRCRLFELALHSSLARVCAERIEAIYLIYWSLGFSNLATWMSLKNFGVGVVPSMSAHFESFKSMCWIDI